MATLATSTPNEAQTKTWTEGSVKPSYKDISQTTTVAVAGKKSGCVLPEVVVFLYFLAFVIKAPVQQFWLFDLFAAEYGLWQESGNRTGYCDNSSSQSTNASDTENKVQSKTSEYVMYINFVSSFVGIVPTLCLGRMTDKYGRKFALYLSQLGLLASLLLTLMVFVHNLAPTFLLVSALMEGLSGSIGLFLTAASSVVADITSPGKQRTFRLATMEAAVAIAISLAAAVSGVLVEAVGYECPVEIGLGSVGLSLLYTLFLLPRSVADDHDSPSSSTPLLKSVECHVKPASRPQKIFKFLVCLTCFAIYVLSYTGDDNISFLYLLHRPFCWAKDKISIFTGAFSLSKWILVLLFILVAKVKIPEPVFALIGALSAASSYLLKGLASSDLLIFAGKMLSIVGSGSVCALLPLLLSLTSSVSLFICLSVWKPE